MSATDRSLDAVLKEIGDFGRYQIYIFALVNVAVIIHSCVHISYVFTTLNLDYRCEIPSCDSNSPEFEPPWIVNAVPYDDDLPVKCSRYLHLNNTSTSTCSASEFDKSRKESCDSYVFKTEEISLLNDFDLYCEENLWKLSLVGTMNNVGQFVGLAISGIISDRYGRRNLLIVGMLLCGVAGVVKAFVTSYMLVVILEFLDATFGAGTYACGFILGVELVGPEKRVLSGTIVSSCYAVGEVIVAGVAWYTQSWRLLTLAMYLPAFFLVTYFWLIPESIRWLLAKGRHKEATDILRKAARINGSTVSEEVLEKLNISNDSESSPKRHRSLEVFKSKILLLRFMNCGFCWITCAFLFYGITLHSTSLAGNHYLDFILTSLVEIPAYFVTYLILDRIGRRITQCGSFFLTGIASVVFIFVPTEIYWLQLSVYLLGKFGATIAFTVIYVLTSEIFPTPLRHTMMGTCSMVGRIGSIVAPLMPVLEQIWPPFPQVLFGGMATTAAILSLFFPETLNVKLPDTIEEAELIGKNIHKVKA